MRLPTAAGGDRGDEKEEYFGLQRHRRGANISGVGGKLLTRVNATSGICLPLRNKSDSLSNVSTVWPFRVFVVIIIIMSDSDLMVIITVGTTL